MSEMEKWLSVFLCLVVLVAPGIGILCWLIFGWHLIDKYLSNKG